MFFFAKVEYYKNVVADLKKSTCMRFTKLLFYMIFFSSCQKIYDTYF